MIKERILQCKMSEIGRIKIGGLEEQVRKTSTGREWQAPVKFEHFVVTTMERDKKGNFLKDESIHTIIGDSPRELGIRLLYNDIELNFRTELAYYQGKTCLCRGDGETAQRLDKATGELNEVACPCSKMDEKGGCKPHGVLSCLLEECSLCGGVHRFATTSWNTIKGIISSLKFIAACTGGKIAGLPLKLKYTKKSTMTKDGNSTVIPVVMIVYEGNPVQMLEAAIRNERQRIEAGIRMDNLEVIVRTEMKQLTATTALIDDEEIDEFHPPVEEEVKGAVPGESKETVRTIDEALKERIEAADKGSVAKNPESVVKTPESVVKIPESAGKSDEPQKNEQAEEAAALRPEIKAETQKEDIAQMSREEVLKGIMRNRNGKKIMTDKFLSLIKPLGVLSARASDWSDEIARKILEITNNYQEA